MLSFIKKLQIPYEKIVGIINTHYHFDHGGGSLNLWRRLVKKNPNFKIIAPQDMREKFRDTKAHLESAQSTFGDFVGTMNPVGDEAFNIVEKEIDLPLQLAHGFTIKLLATPGHTKDHISPAIYKNGKLHFLFLGEAAGTLFHHSKIYSMPTCMPNFVYKTFRQSFDRLRELKPELVGFCHFGAIAGKEDIETFFNDHSNYIENFRSEIIKAYSENPSTKYVIEKTNKFFALERFDPSLASGNLGPKFVKNLQIALTYGMMIDLGYREPKYEKN